MELPPTVQLPASMPLRVPVFVDPPKTSLSANAVVPSAAVCLFGDLVSDPEIEDEASETESLTKSLSSIGSSTSDINTVDSDSLTGDFDDCGTLS